MIGLSIVEPIAICTSLQSAIHVKNDQKLHSVNTSYATRVVEKQQILIVKIFAVLNKCVMGNQSSKTANIRGFYLAHSTLLGMN
jgi:hypothetical protein